MPHSRRRCRVILKYCEYNFEHRGHWNFLLESDSDDDVETAAGFKPTTTPEIQFLLVIKVTTIWIYNSSS